MREEGTRDECVLRSCLGGRRPWRLPVVTHPVTLATATLDSARRLNPRLRLLFIDHYLGSLATESAYYLYDVIILELSVLM